MYKEIKQSKEQYNHLFTEEIASRIKKNVLSTIEAEKKNEETQKLPLILNKSKRRIRRYISIYTGVAIIIFAMVLTLAFVSPTMAKVVAKIPYLGKLFVSKPLITMVTEELNENGIKIDAIGVVYQPKKEIFISIKGSNKYYEDVRKEVEKNVKNILRKNNYDTYSIRVEKARKIENYISKDDQKRLKEDEIINTAIQNEIKKNKFKVLSTSITSSNENPFVELEIPDSTEDLKIEELKRVVNNAIKRTKLDTYSVKVKKVNMLKREQDGRWGHNLSLIGETIISKSKYKVKGIGYSVYPKIELEIRTTVESTDENAKEFGHNLAQIIDEFLKSDEMKQNVKDDNYEINIISKDKKKLND
ncbi:DUF4030 domain-containing protein [Gottfriedia sp. OAE603]|uniref:DUF4030 domain-containing protein n=1 Tax=Gottfriedia sp. OAE603 TaxID=2663872 RepID=UPI00178A735F